MSNAAPAKPHFKRTLDPKLPHKVIKKERCTCSVGKDHAVYGSNR